MDNTQIIQTIVSFLAGGILLLVWVIFLVLMRKFFDKEKIKNDAKKINMKEFMNKNKDGSKTI